MRTVLRLFSLLVLAVPFSNAHGSHDDDPADANLDWAERHMKEEHHITSFDENSFFTLHDYDNSGFWTADEVRRTYGMDDESNSKITESQKRENLREVFNIFDPQKTGSISRSDFLRLRKEGSKLPDLGLGPGHHGDIEYEYEIHHFEKYHGDDATEEDLTHAEDIEHFQRHDREEGDQLRQETMERLSIIEANIPGMFLKSPSV